MHNGRIYSLSILVGITFLAFSSVDSAYAVDYVLSEATCIGAPVVGTWDIPTSTCTKSSTMTFSSGDSLIIPNGVTLAFSTNSNFINRGDITNSGTITLDGTTSSNGQLRNQLGATFTNFGTITMTGTDSNSGVIRNTHNSDFTNSGTITLTGTSGASGQLRTVNTSDFTNSGTITITGTNNNSGQLRITGSASFTNSGTITLTGTNNVSGQVRNFSILINTGSITTNYGFLNNDPDSVLTNSGTLLITGVLDNSGGLIVNTCGEITFASITGNPIEEEFCQTSFGSSAYEDPTIGKSHSGKQMVEDGICIDDTCWTVTAAYHQDFELVEMLSDSTHTISTTVFCQHGVTKCNYVAFGISPYGTNINDSVWKVILQKDHLDNWTMNVIDEEGYLGEVTSTTQIVNDNRFLSASATIEFIKSTPGMILNVEVRDSGGGYRDFKFNDGIAILDSYAYPLIETSYDSPLEIESLCLYENPNKRYTCAFEKIKDQTLIDAQIAYEELMGKQNYHDLN